MCLLAIAGHGAIKPLAKSAVLTTEFMSIMYS